MFLKQKFNLDSTTAQIHFFRLRPNNFPTLRLSQLAVLYYKHANLFLKLMQAEQLETIYSIFDIETTDYWKTHYTFEKLSKTSQKKLTRAFIDLLIINTIIPLKFAYQKSIGVESFENLYEVLRQIQPEKNTLVDSFLNLGIHVKSAFDTQGLIQLKSNYCDKNNCLHCAIGNNILQQKQ